MTTMQEKLQEIANKAVKQAENPTPPPAEYHNVKKFLGYTRRGLMTPSGVILRPDVNCVFPDPEGDAAVAFYEECKGRGLMYETEILMPVPAVKEAAKE